MRALLVALVVLFLVALWVAAAFLPDLRFFAEALTAVVVVAPVGVWLFFFVRSRVRRTSSDRTAGPNAKRAEIRSVRDQLSRSLADRRRVRRGRGAPLYVVVGPAGSGKSTLLDACGFVNNDTSGQRIDAQPVPFAIRCGSDADALDITGQFFDSLDREPWLALLDGVRRRCGSHALAGVIVVLNVTLLQGKEARERRDQAAHIRARLDDIVGRLEEVLPVYLVLTHADCIPSFPDFWAGGRESEEGCFGASFPEGDDRVAREPARAFASEFAVLEDAVHSRAIDRLGREGDPSGCMGFYKFPSELHQLSAPLTEFAEVLGRGGASSQRFMVRGFYFAGASSDGARQPVPGSSLSALALSLFRSVVLPDRDLARPTDSALRKRAKFDQWVALAGLIVTAAVLTPALISYRHNLETVNAVEGAAEALRTAGAALTPGTSLDPIETALDALRQIEAESSSWGVPGWFGPQAARRLRDPLVDAYEGRLHAWMTKSLRPALEKKLDAIAWGPPLADSPSAPETSTPLRDGYEIVRLFATLVDPKGHASSAWAARKLADEWSLLLPAGQAVVAERLNEHARRYLAALERNPEMRWAQTDSLTNARHRMSKQLRAQDMPYRRLLLWARDQPPLRASAVFGAPALSFLQSRGDVQIAGAYTASGWQKIRDALHGPGPWPPEAEVDRWVLDDASIPVDDAELRVQVRQRYLADYSERWLRFLGELKVKTPADVVAARDEITAIADDDGLFRPLFAAFKLNVIHDDDVNSPAPSLTERVLIHVPWFGAPGADAGVKPAPPTAVETAFRPILAFAGSLDGADKSSGPAPLDKYLAILEKLKAALDQDPSPKGSVLDAQAPFIEAKSAVQELLDGTREPIRSSLARLLMPPVMGTVQAVKAEGASSLAADWRSDVWTAWNDKLSRRYPFRSGTPPANFGDFAAFFKPDGILWGFVHAHLGDSVELKGDGRYAAKQGADPVAPEGLQCLSVAQEITDAFFQGQDQGLRFSLQADWTAPDVKDSRVVIGSKETPLPQGQWSSMLRWFGEDVRIEWQQGGRPTQEFGRHSFALFDLFGHLGGLRSLPSNSTVYVSECPPLTLKIRGEGRSDPFRPDFFTRLQCPDAIRVGRP
ncbi:MAG: type VI secretion protein IcmF/TssM N-terminal domain-containing protein [Polyangiaceae bacterium]|jgi:type VI secretion system protein ImpL